MDTFEAYLRQAEYCERQAQSCVQEQYREHLLSAASLWRRMAAGVFFKPARQSAESGRETSHLEVVPTIDRHASD